MTNVKSFIENLELADAGHDYHFEKISIGKRSMYEAADTPSETAAVNYKSIQSFAAGISKERQEDVLNSLLLAQRAATKAFPDDDQVADWHKKYFEVLSNLGWVLEGKEFQVFQSKSGLFEIDNALLEILTAALTGNQLAIALKAIQSLKTLGDGDKRFKFFEQNTHSMQKGNFQLGVATEENGTVSLSSMSFILNSKQNITKILFFSTNKGDTEFKYCLTKATLNDAQYNQARDLVKSKLGDVTSFVAALEI